MKATELQKENERLKELLSASRRELTASQSQLADVTSQLQQSQAQQEAVSTQFNEQLQEKDRRLAALEHQIKLLLLRIKGSRQERIDPDQLLLFSVEELREIAEQLGQGDGEDDLIDDASAGKPRRKSRGRVGKLPEHLEREIKRHELTPAERACPCCGELRREIGVESSEQLELIPARLKVVQHDRVKYACRSCGEHVAIADKSPQPIEKGLPGPGLCAHTVLSKFGDHQPMYRQEDVFWPYLGDWLHPYAVYDFTLSRERDGPQQFLTGFSGYLQADAYSGYDCIYAGEDVLEVACWIHARRYWHQAQDNDSARANMALGFIARLSQIETQLGKAYPPRNLQRERDFEAVAAARQQHSLPILAEFKTWLDNESEDGRILPKSPIRAAFTYTLNQWQALCRYTEAGFLSFENNVAERLVKVSVIGRKNYLFVGSERGGRGAAVMYSLVSSAKANGVEPFAWLRNLFTRLPYHREGEAYAQAAADEPVTSDELDYLLPDKWLEQNPQHKWTIDELRRKERKQKQKPPKRRRRK